MKRLPINPAACVAVVLLSGCSGNRAEVAPAEQPRPAAVGPADPAEVAGCPACGDGQHAVWDMAEGERVHAVPVGFLPFPHATDGSDICELPADLPVTRDVPGVVHLVPPGSVLHLVRKGANILASYGTETKQYVARPDEQAPTFDRLLYGSPLTFRPCPPWA